MPKNSLSKEEQVLRELVNKQLEPHGKTYEDVLDEDEWYLKYTTTEEKEEEFREWGTELMRKKLRVSKKLAKLKMSWFILSYGLKTIR